MDKIKAIELEKLLKGREVGGFAIEKYIDNGKSAAVFRASKNGLPAAVKIFDDELIERYGDDTQRVRIERELTLVGHSDPNLVKILGGGFDNITKNHFIVMEYLDGPNLKETLPNVPSEFIPKLVEQLASAAKFLESRNLVHRDIKPENIVLLDGCQRLILLDLGVLRPIGQPGVTDDEGIKAFVGTLQYSSPEFLLRKEDDDLEGWRALTFYQIGGVIHDLLMRRPLFEEFVHPYGRLVMAIQQEIPVVQSSTAPVYLADLANRCLLKDPKLRSRFVSWQDFQAPTNAPPNSPKDEVSKRIALQRAVADGAVTPKAMRVPTTELRRNVIQYLKVAARSIRTTGALPPITATLHPKDGSGLCIAFDPSSAHDLLHGMRAYVHVEILDASAQAIEVRGCACVHKQKPDKERLCFRVYQGIYDLPALHGAFENFIYAALLWAQRIPKGQSSPGYWPPLPEDE